MAAFSRLLSASVLAGASLSKLPQIVELVRSQKADGLQWTMFAAEFGTQVVAVLYHRLHAFPLHTYGENYVLGIQTWTILILMARFKRRWEIKRLVGVSAGMVAVCALLGLSRSMAAVIRLLQIGSTPMLSVSRVMQIYSNYCLRSTGSLAAMPFAFNLAGCVLRFITTQSDLGGDVVVQLGHIIGMLLNGTLLLQIQLYKQKHKNT